MSDLETRLSQALTIARVMERALNDPHADWQLEYDGRRSVTAAYRTDGGVSFSAEFRDVDAADWMTLRLDGEPILVRPIGLLRVAPSDTVILSLDLVLDGEPAEAA